MKTILSITIIFIFSSTNIFAQGKSCSDLEWTQTDSRTQGGSWIWFPGKGISKKLQIAYEKAEGMALDRLLKECGVLHKEIKFHERCDEKIGYDFIAFVRASIEHKFCDRSKYLKSTDKTKMENSYLRATWEKYNKKTIVKKKLVCTIDNFIDCYGFAEYNFEIGEYEKALKYADIGCHRKDSKSCFISGLIKERHNLLESALKYYERSCSIGHAPGCWNAARHYSMGSKTKPLATPLYEKGCQLKDSDSCAMLGGRKLEIDSKDKTARKLIKSSCDELGGGIGLGCFLTGFYFEHDGAIEKAKKYYGKSCELENSGGCLNLGMIHEKNSSLYKAKTSYKKSCTLGAVKACYQLATVYDIKDHNQKDAIPYYETACAGNLADACGNLAIIKCKSCDLI